MKMIPWYSEASLVAGTHIFRVGTLVQCVRKWRLLAQLDQAAACIHLSEEMDGRTILNCDDVAALATHPESSRV
jgi:hypothetical protein